MQTTSNARANARARASARARVLLALPIPLPLLCLAILSLQGLAPPGTAQTMPSSLTKTGTYPASVLGLSAGAGGIEFDASGTALYLNDPVADQVVKVTVVRNTSGRITGFKSPVVVVASTSSSTGLLDGTLDVSPVGTLVFGNWNTAELEQYSAATKAHTVTLLKNLGLTGSPGGGELFARNGSLLVSDYDNGGIYELPLTLNANLTYTVGKATTYLPTPKGVEGFTLIPKGPFDSGRGLLLANYDNKKVELIGLDPKTQRPFVDAAGNGRFVPLISGLSEPMDVEYDPLTNDLFLSDYSSKTATLLQFSGEIRGGLDGAFDVFGPGCAQKSGAVPSLDANNGTVRINQSLTLRLTNAPVSQGAFLVFGVGSAGNLGGFLFGGTTCRAYTNPVLSVPITTNSTGLGTLTAKVPASALGATLFAQGWAVSTGANALNLTVSDAAVSLIGK